MKNKIALLFLLATSLLILASCSGSRTGYYQRKGYGCPATAALSLSAAERNSI